MASNLLAYARAFAKVAGHYGLESAPDSTSQETSVHALARQFSLTLRAVELKADWWRHPSEPLIVSFEGVPLCARPTSAGYYVLEAPDGERRIDAALAPKLSNAWSALPRLGAARIGARWALQRAPKASSRVSVAMLAVAGLSGLLPPLLVKLVFESALADAAAAQIALLGGMLLLIGLARAFTSYIAATALEHGLGVIEYQAEAALFRRLLAAPPAFFRDHTSAELSGRVFAPSQARAAVGTSRLLSIVALPFGMASMAMMLVLDVRLAGWGVLSIVLLGCGAWRTTTGSAALERERLSEAERATSAVLELLVGLSKLRAAQAVTWGKRRWWRAYRQGTLLRKQARRLNNRLSTWLEFAPLAGALALVLGCLARTEPPTSATFVAFYSAFAQALSVVLSVVSLRPSLAVARATLQRADVVQDAPEEPAQGAVLAQVSGQLALRDVSFGYAAQPVLRAVQLAVAPGEFVGIIGKSGSGKSTLLKLIAGLERPASGVLAIDGHDYATLNLPRLRQQIGIVHQSEPLWEGSILSNISPSGKFSHEAVLAAARDAGLERDLRELRLGLHSLIPFGGATLSGGQRQRVLLARAFLRKPRLLLLDEPTAGLDPAAAQAVLTRLRASGVTTVLVTHDARLLDGATRVYRLVDGVLQLAPPAS